MNARDAARVLGRRGGLARARALPAERRRQVASLGGRARRSSLLIARRIEENLRYAEAIAELRGGPPKVIRMQSFAGPLPGLYPPTSG